MLEETKFNKWWKSLSPQMKTYLISQPIWYDRDLIKAAIVGAVIGLIVGIAVGYDLGLPDFKNYQPTYLKG